MGLLLAVDATTLSKLNGLLFSLQQTFVMFPCNGEVDPFATFRLDNELIPTRLSLSMYNETRSLVNSTVMRKK